MNGWPQHLSRPLVEAQAADLLAWGGAGDVTFPLVRILCPRCGRAVARVDDYAIDNGNGSHRTIQIRATGATGFVTLGAVLRVQLRDIDRPAELGPNGRDTQALALVEVPSASMLPTEIPVWCSRHGDHRIKRSTVAAAARKARTTAGVETLRAGAIHDHPPLSP